MKPESENPILYSSFAQTSGEDNETAMTRAKELSKIEGSCVKIVKHTRTISLPWKFIDRLDDGIAINLDRMLCYYQQKLFGVPIARGNPTIAQKHAVIMEDQPHFQFPVKCRFAVFRPRVGDVLPARIVRVDEGQVVCSIYGVVTANIWKNESKSSKIRGKVGDAVKLKVSKVRLFRRQMQIDAKLAKV